MSLGIHHFVFAPQIRGHDSNFSYNKFSLSQSFPGNSVSAMGMPLFRRQAASISGFDAEYPEQLLDVKRKQKRQSVAGIDQDDLLDPTLLADPDSCFCEFKGVQIHHKLCHEEEHQEHSLHYHDTSQQSHQARRIGFPIILLHGFGASVFSWNRVMKPLARVTGSQVLAFDRPAFGLTSRVNSTSGSEDSRLVNPYSMAFSVLATLSFIDLLATEKAIIIGHSAGSLVAVNTYFEAPERVAALILIAPATIAPFVSVKVNKMDESRQESQIQDSDPNSVVQKNPFMRIRKILSKLFMYVARGIMKMVVEMKDMIGSLFKKVLIAVLRSALAVMLVRMVIDKFGIAAIRNAWYDANHISDHVIQGYTKPLRAKDWDRALVEYTVALLTDSASESKPPLSKRLIEISCPVLIVTGDTDRIIPSWNAERLSRVIPGSCLEVIKNCGHLPHEERVEEFVAVVEKFLQRVFGASEGQLLQTAA